MAKMEIVLKRAYYPPKPEDGYRVLVDRLWPRGMTKEKLRLDAWMKDIAPSDGLRRWVHHDPSKWDDFRQRYFDELRVRPELVEELREKARDGRVTLVFGARDEMHNNAAVLKEYLEGG
jgi:uncharacterized protein YeaO (DUF488 family)